jgi:hypothetical protein
VEKRFAKSYAVGTVYRETYTKPLPPASDHHGWTSLAGGRSLRPDDADRLAAYFRFELTRRKAK